MRLVKWFNGDAHDCLICAFRVLIFWGFSITYIAKPECPHTELVKKPKLKRSKYVTLLSIGFSFIMMIGLSLNLHVLITLNLELQIAYEYAILALKYLVILVLSICFCIYNKKYIHFTNGLIELIEKRKLFGIETILTRAITRKFQIFNLITFPGFAIYITTFLYISVKRASSVEIMSISIGTACVYLNALNFALYLIYTTVLYKITLDTCYKNIEDTLKCALICRGDKNRSLVETPLQEKIKYLQRFYLAVCRNYRNHLVAFGNIIYFTLQFVFNVFMGVQCYLYYSHLYGDQLENAWTVNNFYVTVDNVYLAVVVPVFFILINRTYQSGQDLLSFLYKYPISKLTAAEAAQVEMLMITLTMEKPELNTSNIFTIGTNLLASISGTIVTYVLVALQFHASFGKKKPIQSQ